MKNKASLALNVLRWKGKTDEEKKAHTKMMRDVKATRRLVTVKPDEKKLNENK